MQSNEIPHPTTVGGENGPGSRRQPGDDERVSVDVLTEVVIERPCADVAAYAEDPSHTPDWYANIDSMVWRKPAPVTVGSQLDFVARFLGRRLANAYEVIELVPGQGW